MFLLIQLKSVWKETQGGDPQAAGWILHNFRSFLLILTSDFNGSCFKTPNLRMTLVYCLPLVSKSNSFKHFHEETNKDRLLIVLLNTLRLVMKLILFYLRLLR